MSAQRDPAHRPELKSVSPAAAGANPTLSTLTGCLERLEAAHAELCETAELKREAIVKGDLPGLEAVLERERKIVATIGQEEARRQMMVRLVRKGLGLPDAESSRLTDLLPRLPEPARARLTELRDGLQALLKTLRFKDRVNTELLRASLEHVDAFLRMIRDTAGATTTYNTRGKHQSGGRSLIDREA